MKVYLLYYPKGSIWHRYDGTPIKRQSTQIRLGGGSSTPAYPKVYDSIKQAERYAKEYGAIIKEIELDDE